MSHCHIHAIEYPYEDGCPRCPDAEELTDADHVAILNGLSAAASHRSEIKKALAAAEYKRANPGDYECPSCGYKTLKRGFPRCPHCRGHVEQPYWADVRKREEAAELQKKAAAEEWKRTEPERVAAAARKAAEEIERASRLAADERSALFWRRFWKFYYFYLIPILSVQTCVLIVGQYDAVFTRGSAPIWSNIFLQLCPGFNWIGYLGLLITSGGHLTGPILIFWVTAGVIGYWTSSGSKKARLTRARLEFKAYTKNHAG